MKRYIDNCCRPARIPSHEQAKIQEYRKMVNAFQVYLGRKPTEWEILHNMNMDSRQLEELERAIRMTQIGSLDSSLAEDEDGDTLGDIVLLRPIFYDLQLPWLIVADLPDIMT